MITAVQDRLVTTTVLADPRQRLDNPQPQLLPLLVLIHRNILNMPNTSQPSQELPLHKYRADRNDTIGRLVYNDNRVIGLGCGTHGIELRYPGIFSGI